MKSETYISNTSQSSSDFSLSDFLRACLKSWHWFVVSFVVVIGLALLYVFSCEPVYERTEEVLIKDQDAGGGIADITSAFSSMGLVANNTNVNNELISLTSPAVVREVARRLHLDMNYTRPGGLHKVTLYGANLPVILSLKEVTELQGASLRLTLFPDSTITIDKFTLSSESGKKKLPGKITLKPGQRSSDSPLGDISLIPNPDYTGSWPEKELEINVIHSPIQLTVEAYKKKLFGDLVDMEAEVIGLTVKDVSVERAVDFLEELLVVYNENWIVDKNKIAVATSAFINDRLERIHAELGDVDSAIASYLTSTGTPDLATSAEISMKKETEIASDILELETKHSVAQQLREYIADDSNRLKVIPLNVGIGSDAVEKQIAEYNQQLLSLTNIKQPGASRHPLIAEKEKTLDGLRESVVRGLDSHISSLDKSLSQTRKEYAGEHGKVVRTAEKALPLLSDERQRTIKESLYLFLLQKREENELSQAFTAYNTRVITPPMGPLRPVSPRKFLILALALILSVAIPLLALYIRESNDNVIHSKKELGNVHAPFAGEIPQAGKKRRRFRLFRKFKDKKQEETAPLAIVSEGKRDVVNEAFRVVRGNLEFMTGNVGKGTVLAITSFNPGSGKSFIGYNLAASFALKGKRILLIDCDMRHASTSMYVGSPSRGLSTLLSGNGNATASGEGNWKKYLLSPAGMDSVKILPVGQLPPNPAELLEAPVFRNLIEETRKEFDFILLDCPPINIVVDTQIAARSADSTLFVLRAGLLKKDAIIELNELYDEKRLPKISIVLNGTEAVHSRYYTYGNYQNI